jgi:hypothetical protein
MISLIDYVKTNGDYTFFEKEFNEVDAVLMSAIVYVNFSNIIKDVEVSLGDALEKYLKATDRKTVIKLDFIQKDIYKLVKVIKDKIRYRGILLSNYVYDVTYNKQFCAITMKLPTGEKLIVYEGTDHNLVGWEEDFTMLYQFPVPADTDAINYLNENVSIWDKNVIVLGHSKGGHLAMTAATFCKWYKKFAIKKVYNFDGPGFRYDEFNSKKFKRMTKKLEYIIPNYSIFGLLLRHPEEVKVVKTTKKDIMAHSMFNWLVEEESFVFDRLSRISRNLDKSIIMWLEQHDDEERKKVVTDVFKYLKDNGIEKITDMVKLKNVFTLIKNLDDLDKGTKDLLSHFIKYNIDYHVANKNDEIIIK